MNFVINAVNVENVVLLTYHSFFKASTATLTRITVEGYNVKTTNSIGAEEILTLLLVEQDQIAAAGAEV